MRLNKKEKAAKGGILFFFSVFAIIIFCHYIYISDIGTIKYIFMGIFYGFLAVLLGVFGIIILIYFLSFLRGSYSIVRYMIKKRKIEFPTRFYDCFGISPVSFAIRCWMWIICIGTFVGSFWCTTLLT